MWEQRLALKHTSPLRYLLWRLAPTTLTEVQPLKALEELPVGKPRLLLSTHSRRKEYDIQAAFVQLGIRVQSMMGLNGWRVLLIVGVSRPPRGG